MLHHSFVIFRSFPSHEITTFRIHYNETTRKANEEARQAAETLRQTNTANAIEKTEAATQAALDVVGQVSLEDRDEGKQYTYKLFVENGYPGIELTEVVE